MAEPLDTLDANIKNLFRGIQVGGAAFFKTVSEFNETAGPLPAAQVTFAGGSQEDFATGRITENGWRFVCDIYISLADSKRAQQQLRDVYPAVLSALRADQTLGGAADRVAFTETGAPSFDYDRKYLHKSIEITAYTEEG